MHFLPFIQSVIRGAWRRRVLMLVPLLVVIPASLVLALVWPTKYETRALVLLQEYSGLNADQPAYVRAQEIRDKVKSLEALVTSEFILRRIMQKFAKGDAADGAVTERDLEEYRRRISLEQVGNQFFVLKLQGPEREGLSRELSAILSALFESLLTSNDTSLDASSFIARTHQEELQQLEEALAAGQRDTGSISVSGLTAKRQQALGLAQTIERLEGEVSSTRAVLAGDLKKVIPDVTPEPGAAGALVRRLQEEKEKLTSDPDAKVFQEAERKRRISALDALRTAASVLANLEGQLAKAGARLSTLKAEIQRGDKLLQERVALRERADILRKKFEGAGAVRRPRGGAADIQLLRAPARIQVIDTPKEPRRPINSRLLILLGGIAAALGLSGAFAVLAEQFDDTVRSTEMLQAATGLKTISQFPSLAGKGSGDDGTAPAGAKS